MKCPLSIYHLRPGTTYSKPRVTRTSASGTFDTQALARLWRMPVVTTTSMVQGNFLAGAFKRGAKIFDRQDPTVEVSTEHSDFFIKNKVAIRAEQRLALAVYRPLAFLKGNFATALSL